MGYENMYRIRVLLTKKQVIFLVQILNADGTLEYLQNEIKNNYDYMIKNQKWCLKEWCTVLYSRDIFSFQFRFHLFFISYGYGYGYLFHFYFYEIQSTASKDCSLSLSLLSSL